MPANDASIAPIPRKPRLMLKALLAPLVMLMPTAATADSWSFEDAEVPIAYVDNGAAQLQFACRGGDLAMGFWVRSPERAVAGAQAMNIAILPDAAAGAKLGSADGVSFAQDMPLIHSDGSSMIVRGPVARQWARIAQGAKAAMSVAFVHRNSKGVLEVYDTNRFGAQGSAAAIKRVLARCG
jgi:hypothetical protein